MVSDISGLSEKSNPIPTEPEKVNEAFLETIQKIGVRRNQCWGCDYRGSTEAHNIELQSLLKAGAVVPPKIKVIDIKGDLVFQDPLTEACYQRYTLRTFELIIERFKQQVLAEHIDAAVRHGLYNPTISLLLKSFSGNVDSTLIPYALKFGHSEDTVLTLLSRVEKLSFDILKDIFKARHKMSDQLLISIIEKMDVSSTEANSIIGDYISRATAQKGSPELIKFLESKLSPC